MVPFAREGGQMTWEQTKIRRYTW